MTRKRISAPAAGATTAQAASHECGRCGRIHNGAKPGPGWSEHPDFGKLCDDCSESVQLAAKMGLAA